MVEEGNQMNHKRKRPKNRRAGCLMCKPHKMNGWKEKSDLSHSNQKLELLAKIDLNETDSRED